LAPEPDTEGGTIMNELNDFDERVKSKFAEHQERLKSHNHALATRMQKIDEKFQRYTAEADRLTQSVLRPRMERLAAHFENAFVLEPDEAGRHHSVCVFKHTERYPATARLEIGFGRDRDNDNLEVHYRVQILPIFFDFPKEDCAHIPLEPLDEEKVVQCIEQKIGDFLDSYLKIEFVEQYQSNNLVADPVCGMFVNKYHAPAQMDHEGTTYYFCVDECRKKFAADPGAYMGGKK
jgi:YHS domain-containing protein